MEKQHLWQSERRVLGGPGWLRQQSLSWVFRTSPATERTLVFPSSFGQLVFFQRRSDKAAIGSGFSYRKWASSASASALGLDRKLELGPAGRGSPVSDSLLSHSQMTQPSLQSWCATSTSTSLPSSPFRSSSLSIRLANSIYRPFSAFSKLKVARR